MSSEHLHQIRQIRSFATGEPVFIRDIKGVNDVPESCPFCHDELSVEFIITQPGMFQENALATHIIVLLCERCDKARAVRYMESEAGDLSVQDFDRASRLFNIIMDRFEAEHDQREENRRQMGDGG